MQLKRPKTKPKSRMMLNIPKFVNGLTGGKKQPAAKERGFRKFQSRGIYFFSPGMFVGQKSLYQVFAFAAGQIPFDLHVSAQQSAQMLWPFSQSIVQKFF